MEKPYIRYMRKIYTNFQNWKDVNPNKTELIKYKESVNFNRIRKGYTIDDKTRSERGELNYFQVIRHISI